MESALQEAWLRAVERWGSDFDGALHQGWLMRVAHNLVVDELRRARRSSALERRLLEEPHAGDSETMPELDDELCLTFLCCHPLLSRAAQVALTLRVVYGFSTPQIARAFLSDERTLAQRLLRAKQRLAEQGAHFDLPSPADIPTRLEAILDVVYQLFTEGHTTTDGERGVDEALCAESLRLLRLITNDPRVTSPAAEALRALVCFHVARNSARHADDGSLLLLQEQDRSRWNAELLAEGFAWLDRSARGEVASRFHAEAGIAACHAAAPTYALTDWPRILDLYEVLRAISPSPVVEVNRAFAVAMCRGAPAGLDELDAIEERALLARYPYALATYAELHASLGNVSEARSYLERALLQQTSPAERALLARKLRALG